MKWAGGLDGLKLSFHTGSRRSTGLAGSITAVGSGWRGGRFRTTAGLSGFAVSATVGGVVKGSVPVEIGVVRQCRGVAKNCAPHPQPLSSFDLFSPWPKLASENKRKIAEAIIEKIVIGDGEIDLTFSCLPTSEELCKSQQQMAPARGCVKSQTSLKLLRLR
jgi:hypothetical protein